MSRLKPRPTRLLRARYERRWRRLKSSVGWRRGSGRSVLHPYGILLRRIRLGEESGSKLPHSTESRRGSVWSAAACRRFRGRSRGKGESDVSAIESRPACGQALPFRGKTLGEFLRNSRKGGARPVHSGWSCCGGHKRGMRSGTQETRMLPCPYGVLLRQDASEMIRTENQKRRRYERWGGRRSRGFIGNPRYDCGF
jgi:hypothetical protein